MLISKFILEDKEQELRDAISKMEELCCVDNFIKYIDEGVTQKSSLCELENLYISKLTHRFAELLFELKIEEDLLCGKTSTEILKTIYLEGHFGYLEMDLSDKISKMEDYKDTFAFPILQKFMLDTLDAVVEDVKRTKQEEEERAKANKKAHLQAEIENYKKYLKNSEEQLKKLN